MTSGSVSTDVAQCSIENVVPPHAQALGHRGERPGAVNASSVTQGSEKAPSPTTPRPISQNLGVWDPGIRIF